MRNTSTLATAYVPTPGGTVSYEGTARIDGVPGSHAPVPLEFTGIAGSSCGALLPTGNVVDVVEGLRVTCVDNGMPVVSQGPKPPSIGILEGETFLGFAGADGDMYHQTPSGLTWNVPEAHGVPGTAERAPTFAESLVMSMFAWPR